MKKIYSFLMVSAIALTANAQTAQLVFNETFDGYASGNLSTSTPPQGNWVATGSGADVQVNTATPLTYPGYPNSIPYITVASVNGIDPHKLFSTAINTTTDLTVYMSFLVRASYAKNSNGNPNYSIALFNTADPDVPLRFFIGEEPSTADNIQFGIAIGNTAPVFTTTNASFTYNTTYLIVIRYDIVNGALNDDAYLWVNPSLSSEPSTSLATNGTGVTVSNVAEFNFGSVLNALQISQSSNSDSPDGDYDGFRVAYGATSAQAWTVLNPAGGALPVQLTSFNASQDGLNNTKLIWNTAEENGIVSYMIEKSTDGKNFASIGTVPAAGQKTYSFTDMQASSDYTYYRLKIVEMDGTWKLSSIISLKSKLSLNISLSPNPVKNNLFIQHPKVIGEGHLQIVNMNGQLIKDLRLPASAVISNVDMSGFANGMYHVVFRNGSNVFSKMVLKN
jgi:hypothetical protein